MTNKELQDAFKKYNRKYFGGKLSKDTQVKFQKIAQLGRTNTYRVVFRGGKDADEPPVAYIHISEWCRKSRAVSLCTLLHEMCHVATLDEKALHGKRFYKELRRVMRAGGFDLLV